MKRALIILVLIAVPHISRAEDTLFRKSGLQTKSDVETTFVGFQVATAGDVQKGEDTLPPAPGGKTWKLVWHDEFDGDKLDDSKWDSAE